MRRTNQNVILSHGGKHGVQSRTLLKGQVVSADAAQHIPAAAIDARPANPGSTAIPAGSEKLNKATVQTSAKAATPPSAGPVAVKAAKSLPPTPKPVEVKAPKPLDPARFGGVRDETPRKDQAPESPSEGQDPLEVSAPDPLGAEGVSEPAEAPAEESVTVPSSKRQLKRMSKANSIKLAQNLALPVPTNAEDITVKQLHRMLATELGL